MCLGCESQKNLISVWHDDVPMQTLTSIHTSSLMTLSYWDSEISLKTVYWFKFKDTNET